MVWCDMVWYVVKHSGKLWYCYVMMILGVGRGGVVCITLHWSGMGSHSVIFNMLHHLT